MSEFKTHSNELYTLFHKALNGRKLTIDEMIKLTMRGILYCEKFVNLCGNDKKVLLIQVMTRLVDGYGPDDKIVKELLNNFIEDALPPMIDASIGLARSGIKSTWSRMKKCCTRKCKCRC